MAMITLIVKEQANELKATHSKDSEDERSKVVDRFVAVAERHAKSAVTVTRILHAAMLTWKAV